MSKIPANEYMPDLVSAPGETLEEMLEERGMTQSELAHRMGRPKKTINEIVQGKAAITPDTALQLERVLGVPASFWLRREQQYRESLARQAEQASLNDWVDWLKQFPIKVLRARGIIGERTSKGQQVLDLLRFFGVASPDAWRAVWEQEIVAFRKSRPSTHDMAAIATWLREGELQAQTIECALYNADAFREVLTRIRKLTTEPPEVFQDELIRLCAKAGVAVVFVPEIPRTGICGATRWATSAKALIQLSLRYKTDDQLWFTFFHEAIHILLHGKREVFLEGDTSDGKAKAEAEANELATDMLISARDWQRFLAAGRYHTKLAIHDFAQKVGIAPGIVVGRLQHEGLLLHSHCNDLKCRLTWATEQENGQHSTPDETDQ